MQPWELLLRQMSPGPFRGWIEYVQVNGILLYREHCTRRVMATGSTPPGCFVFGSSSSPRTRIDWCGAKIAPGLLAFARASTEIDVVIPEPSDHVVLLVPEALLLEYLGEDSSRSPPDVSSATWRSAGPHDPRPDRRVPGVGRVAGR